MSTCGDFSSIGLSEGIVNIRTQCKESVITPLTEKTRRLNAPGSVTSKICRRPYNSQAALQPASMASRDIEVVSRPPGIMGG